MIAYLTLIVASPLITASFSEHHNYAERIITCHKAIITDRMGMSPWLIPILSFP